VIVELAPHRGEATTRAFLAAVEQAASAPTPLTLTVGDDSSMTLLAADGSTTTVGYSSAAALRAADVSVGLDGTAFTAVADDASADVRLALLGERHVPAALAAIAAGRLWGIGLSAAAAAVASVTAAEHGNLSLARPSAGVALVDDGYDTTALSTTEALKTLAEITVGTRSVAVLGELDFPVDSDGHTADEQERREEHHRIGLLVVRLNIDRLIVVGHGARHIHVAAGLEGSWDGESVLVETPDRAYDLLNETELHERHDGVVVLVKLNASDPLAMLTRTGATA
jgi:UDP-N-acetylmuramoyl-tripeptide--D-alanyl-D-alanine ligase